MAKTKIQWTSETEAHIKHVPFFVRPLAKKKAEDVARERGLDTITMELLDELRAKYAR